MSVSSLFCQPDSIKIDFAKALRMQAELAHPLDNQEAAVKRLSRLIHRD